MQEFIEQFISNHSNVWYLIAGISFIVELSVMGMAGPLLFFAIAAFITAILVNFGFVTSVEMEIFIAGALTAIIALLLWKPLRRFQNKGNGKDTSSDMIGLKVKAASNIDHNDGSVRYSGVNWPARLSEGCNEEQVNAGVQCEIVAVEGTVMLVKPTNR